MYGVSYASVYEQTLSRQCCNLFISWLWMHHVIVLPSVARACDDQSTVHLDWGGYQFCACAQCLRDKQSFASYFDLFLCHFAGFHVANRAVTLLLLLRKCIWSVLAYFCSEYSHSCTSCTSSTSIDSQVKSGHRQRVYVAVFVTHVADQLFALNRGCSSACLA